MKKVIRKMSTLFMVLTLLLSGCSSNNNDSSKKTDKAKTEVVEKQKAAKTDDKVDKKSSKKVKSSKSIKLKDIPKYDGEPYVVINDNEPFFTKDEISKKSFEKYAPLDKLGRCHTAIASIGIDLMPSEKRGNISSVKPSGWQIAKYDCVDGKYLYNRCHLIGYQLSGENANERNLITGTRALNVDGMLPFENMVADYVKESHNHVMYRVTPMYQGDNLLADGVLMEALSVEDNGKGIKFNVFAYNQQPNIKINLKNGENSSMNNSCTKLATHGRTNYQKSSKSNYTHKKTNYHKSTKTNYQQTTSKPVSTQGVIRGNYRSKIYHMPGQRDYENMADSKYLVNFKSEQEAINSGYRRAKR